MRVPFRTQLARSAVLRRSYRNLRDLTYAMREGLWRRANPGAAAPMSQALRRHTVPVDVRTADELMALLTANRITYATGRHAIYLPPQPALAAWLGEAVTFYPGGAGFKILKDMRPPTEAQYITADHEATTLRRSLIGTPLNQLVTANCLYASDLGPRVWDVTEWAGPRASLTVFVVDHVGGRAPGQPDYDAFLARLEKELSTSPVLRMAVRHWRTTGDFVAPACNGNLLVGADGPRYVDFHNFCLTSDRLWSQQIVKDATRYFHFGAGRLHRGDEYLYQSVPGVSEAGKRNTSKRRLRLKNLFEQHRVSLDGRLVLDVGCNSGMMMHTYLANRAAWALGWDRAHIAGFTERLLLSLGDSRFNVIGGDLHTDYPFDRDIPVHLTPLLSESMVSYLSIRQHIGLAGAIRALPWRLFLYEGHQSESLDDARGHLAPLLVPGVKLLHLDMIADGDSRPRPLALLRRDD